MTSLRKAMSWSDWDLVTSSLGTSEAGEAADCEFTFVTGLGAAPECL